MHNIETNDGTVTDLTTLPRLIGLVRRTLGAQAAGQPLRIDARLSELGISSIKMVSLMLAIEAEFNLSIPQEQITPENFHSIACIASMLTKISSAD